MVKTSVLYKTLVVGVIALFISFGIQSAFAITQTNDIKQLEKNLPVDFEDKLSAKHILPLLRGFFHIEKKEVQHIIRNTIIEIIKTGDATIDEIREYANSSEIIVKGIYLFAEVKTTKTTDGSLNCYPGNFRTHFFGYTARGSYVRYKTWYLALYGWYLEIDGNIVKEMGGHLFGYHGQINCNYDPWSYPPGDYSSFNINGNAILIFHGA